jgi:hypothetical protein
MGQAYPTDVKALFVKEEAIIRQHGGEVRRHTAGVNLLLDAQNRISGMSLFQLLEI